jgi:hypothetical protein
MPTKTIFLKIKLAVWELMQETGMYSIFSFTTSNSNKTAIEYLKL